MIKRKIFQTVFGLGLALMVFGNTVFASDLGGTEKTTDVTGENDVWIEEASETMEAPVEEEEIPVTEEAPAESVETPETEEAPAESGEAAETEEGEKTPETEEASAEGEDSSEENGETAGTDETSTDSGESAEISGTESEPEKTDDTAGTEEDMETVSAADQAQEETVAAPKFTIKGIFGGRNVTFTSESQGAVIYYKSGSSNITLEDQHVENGGTVTFTNFYGTIYAKAYKDGVWSNAAKFILKIPVVNNPTITVEGNKATIRTTTPSSYICYTTDGSKPSWENGKRISNSGGTVTVEEGSTIRAVAVRSCFTDSQEAKAYVPVLPVAFEVKGVFGGRNVTMTSNTAGAEIYYSTTTGSITTNDKKLTNGGNIDFSEYYGTVYARAYKNGKWSNVSRLILKIPTINKPSIIVTSNIATIMTTTPSCYICYTTDGSDPSPTHGTKVFGSRAVIQVPAGRTVMAMAIRSCFTNSEVVSAYVRSTTGKVLTGGSAGDNYSPVSYTSTSRWSHVMRSYLYQNADRTISVVDAPSIGILNVDTYSQNLLLLNSKAITMELPMFGGFYSGSQYNYVVYGQSNPDQNDTLVTYKVVKYSKNWERLGAADYVNNNTVVPFDAGSLRMTEADGYLYIRTCHEMYKSADGLNHQANVTFSVNTATMKVADGCANVSHYPVGYVSHSFNQFIAMDEGRVVGVDLGDAYPRAVVLTRTRDKIIDGNISSYDYFYRNSDTVSLFSIPGATGANCTGVTVGGFEVANKNYLVAINTIDHSKVTNYTSFTMEGLDRDERDVVLLVCSKEQLDAEHVKTIKFTNYVNQGKLGSTPYLIKIADDRFVLMWEEFAYEETTNAWGWVNKGWATRGIRYVVIDENGNKLTDVMSMADGVLSYSCQPVYINDEIIWYVNTASGRMVYRIYVH